jgi:hypothetical protein
MSFYAAFAGLAQLVERLTRNEKAFSFVCGSKNAQSPCKNWEVEGHRQTSKRETSSYETMWW